MERKIRVFFFFARSREAAAHSSSSYPARPMAELMLFQVFVAGRKVVRVVESSEDYCCAEEVEALAKRYKVGLARVGFGSDIFPKVEDAGGFLPYAGVV